MITYKIFEEKGFYVVKKRVFFFFWRTVIPGFAKSNTISPYNKLAVAREMGYFLGLRVFITETAAVKFIKQRIKVDQMLGTLFRRLV